MCFGYYIQLSRVSSWTLREFGGRLAAVYLKPDAFQCVVHSPDRPHNQTLSKDPESGTALDGPASHPILHTGEVFTSNSTSLTQNEPK